MSGHDPYEHPYGSALFDQHAKLLADSDVAPEVAAARGYRSADNKAQLHRAGFGPVAQSPPGLLIPLWSITGEQRGWQYRPDHPRTDQHGRTVKYETPRHMKMVLDVPPSTRDRVADGDVPLWITEGSRKADSAATAGLACIALLGVWNWRNGDGVLPDWDEIPLKGRQVLIAFDSDVMLNPKVHGAMTRLAGVLSSRAATVGYVYLPAGEGGTKVGLDDYLAAGHDVDDLMALVSPELRRPVTDDVDEPEVESFDDVPDEPLCGVLDDVASFLTRFVSFPYPGAGDAVTLWIAHTWVVDRLDMSPRLVLTSAEKQSGKTRIFEVALLLARDAELTSGMSEAYMFRAVEEYQPTLLVDEADTIFGRKASNAHEGLRGLLNAGFTRGATVGRIEGEGAGMKPVRFSVFGPAALAGIGKLPDTIVDRAVVLRMRRRAPDERVEPFRRRLAGAQAERLRRRLGAAMNRLEESVFLADPVMPEGITDRPADVWESLLQIADAADATWAARARAACLASNTARQDEDESYGVNLLVDIRDVFDETGFDRLASADLAEALARIEESPWGDVNGKGKQLDASGLARRLRHFAVTPDQLKIDGRKVRGYDRVWFEDAWSRYAPPAPPEQPGTPVPGTDPVPENPHRDREIRAGTGVPGNGEGGGTYHPSDPVPDPEPAPTEVRL